MSQNMSQNNNYAKFNLEKSKMRLAGALEKLEMLVEQKINDCRSSNGSGNISDAKCQLDKLSIENEELKANLEDITKKYLAIKKIKEEVLGELGESIINIEEILKVKNEHSESKNIR